MRVSNRGRVTAFQSVVRLDRATNRARFAFLASLALAIGVAIFFVAPTAHIAAYGPGVHLDANFQGSLNHDGAGLSLSSDAAREYSAWPGSAPVQDAAVTVTSRPSVAGKARAHAGSLGHPDEFVDKPDGAIASGGVGAGGVRGHRAYRVGVPSGHDAAILADTDSTCADGSVGVGKITLEGVESDAFRISWPDLGCPGDYVVRHMNRADPVGTSVTATVPSDTTTYTARNLTAGAEYLVRVLYQDPHTDKIWKSSPRVVILTPTGLPEVSITSGPDIAEGGTARFNVAVSPPLVDPLTVHFIVTERAIMADPSFVYPKVSGYGGGQFVFPSALGRQTVTVPAGDSADVTVRMTGGDNYVGADGKVTATLAAGSGYTVAAAPANTATLSVVDRDVGETPQVYVSFSGVGAPMFVPTVPGGNTYMPSVVEGEKVNLVVVRSLASPSPLAVRLTISENGYEETHEAYVGTRTLTIPANAWRITLNIVTDEDDAPYEDYYEDDGLELTATLSAGSGYTVYPFGAIAKLRIIDDDVMVGNLTFGAVTYHSIQVSWAKVPFADAYEVRWWQKADKNGTLSKVATKSTSHTIEGLDSATEYVVSVLPVQDGRVKSSLASPEQSVTTKAAAWATTCRDNAHKVQGLSADQVADTSIRFSWSRLDCPGGYVVRYWQPSDRDNTLTAVTVPRSQTSYTAQDLVAGTAYSIRVLYQDPDGRTPWKGSSLLTVTTLPLPSNSPATGKPMILGKVQAGSVLHVDNEFISDANGLSKAIYSYQWLADGVALSGATGHTRVLSTIEQGNAVSVRVSFTDDDGNAESVTSAPTVPVVSKISNPAQSVVYTVGYPFVGGSLRAVTIVSDADGLTNVRYSYQWLANGEDIPGATGRFYLVTANEVGKYVSVRVSFTDDAGNAESATSRKGHRVQRRGNFAADGRPVIVGTAQVGQTLKAGTSGISDYNGLEGVTYAYQWLADGKAITGATGSVYTLTASEVGKVILVRVSFTDDDGHAESVTSVATEVVADKLDSPATGKPVISGTVQVGQTLTASMSSIGDPDGLARVTYAYQWLADSTAITGATGSSYTLTAVEQGKVITVTVSFTDDAGNDESATSEATGAVPSKPDSPATGNPVISGAARVGQILTAGTSAIVDADGLTKATYAYQWLADGAVISGATGSAYRLTGSELGKAITVRVTVTDDGSNAAVLTSEATGAVGAYVGSPATGLPVISGIVQVGRTLTVDTSGIADADGLAKVNYAYQWQSDGIAISGATSSTYQLNDAENARTISVQVIFTDDAGNDEILTSATTGVVAPRTNAPATGLPAISGTVEVGQTLTVSTSAIADPDGLTKATYAYQWLADGLAIAGATESSYVLTDNEQGKTIIVLVSFVDDAGYPESLASMAAGAAAATPNAPATGVPTISGTVKVGGILTVNTDGISDDDGMTGVVYGYQWLADGTAIAGATESSYVLTDSEQGRTISVQVSFVDDAGYAESVTSSATGAVIAGTNTPATGVPTISGTAQVGETLTASISAIADADGLTGASYAYQWLADGAVIAGATGASYVLTTSDRGTFVTVRVSFTDDAGYDETVSSSATGEVAARPNTPATGVPTISGTAEVGQLLTAGTAGIVDANGLTRVSYAYQWLADGTVIAGSTGRNYVPKEHDKGKAISVRVSFTDDDGYAESLTSAATGAVAAKANTPATGLPTISGTAQVGQNLVANTSTISDADGLTNVTYSYQWLADGTAISGATGSSYTLTASEQGKAIRVRVSFTDDNGYAESLTSSATGTVAARSNRPPTGLPTISGLARVGKTLTVSTSGIADADGLGTFSYQWLANGRAISGATGSSHTLFTSMVGKAISVRVSFTDGRGHAESLTSAATGVVVVRIDHPALGRPTISGTARVGQTLTAGTSGIADANGLTKVAYAYQWLADGRAIAGATGSSYTLTTSEQHKAITVRVNFTDDDGNSERLTSAATGAVAAVSNSPATGRPAISGTVRVGATLTAGTSGIADADGLTKVAYAYQWLADGATIYGATDRSYRLRDREEGKAIAVRVSFTDDNGNGESLTSAATGVVPVRPNSPATGKPTVGGVARVGKTLTADTSAIVDADGVTNASYAYQWLADGTAISGATGSSYTLTASEQGKAIRVRVSFTDYRGHAESLTSVATGAVSPAATASVPNVAIGRISPVSGLEGESARFMITAVPASASPLPVKIMVTQSGNFVSSAQLGEKTITVSAGSLYTRYTVPTANDSVRENHGAVIVTLVAGSVYTVNSSFASATVQVLDDDLAMGTPSPGEVTHQSIKVSWPYRWFATGYEVQWWQQGNKSGTLSKAVTSSTSYTIGGLNPETGYVISVLQARNGSGNPASASPTVSVTTKPAP